MPVMKSHISCFPRFTGPWETRLVSRKRSRFSNSTVRTREIRCWNYRRRRQLHRLQGRVWIPRHLPFLKAFFKGTVHSHGREGFIDDPKRHGTTSEFHAVPAYSPQSSASLIFPA